MANCIGPYELIAELGRGAMGKVYRARDTRLDREVALKVLWPQLAEQPAAVARFEREARAAARLRHSNVVAVFDVDAADGYHYLAMECVAGPSLRELLKQPLPVDKALHYFKQILSGLGVAHEQGVIHRDLKPGNILIEAATGTVKLADFGLARIVEEETALTQSGEMLGTIEYMAPELARGEAASARSDLYAAGVVLYRMLTGRFPFQGATPVAILKAHKCGTYPSATTIDEGLPPQVDAVIARLLACEPANRYPDCQAVFADLERWEKGEAIPLEFAAAYEPIDHELERHRVPGWKRAWARVTTWYRYQWLEAFDRTELTAIRIRDEVTTAETELGKVRRRLEEATLLRNRVRARADEARGAMRASEQAAEQAYGAGDETLMRQHLAAKLEAKERAEDLEKEATESEQVVALAQQELATREMMIAELRHGADLLLARRRRAKLEMSILGVLSTGGRRWGERSLAAVKLLGPVLFLIVGAYYLWRPATPLPPQAVRTANSNQQAITTQESGWSIKAPLPTERTGFCAVVVDEKVYVLGGFDERIVRNSQCVSINTVERYDPVSNRWESWGTIPEPLMAITTAVVLQGKIYYVLYDPLYDIVQEYDPQTRTSRQITTLPTKRGQYAITAVGDEIYLIGGYINLSQTTDRTVDVFCPATGKWRVAAPLAVSRCDAAVAVLDGEIYVIGGANNDVPRRPGESGNRTLKYVNSMERYDPTTDRWEQLMPVPEPRTFCTRNAVALNGNIYVLGDCRTAYPPGKVEEYDPQRNCWTEISQTRGDRMNERVVAVNNEILVMGGTGTQTLQSSRKKYVTSYPLTSVEGFRP